MPLQPIPTKKFKKFLKNQGLVYVRTEASHEIWDRPDDSLLRPVTFWGHKKEVPGLHIHTNLKTIGMTYKEFKKVISKL